MPTAPTLNLSTFKLGEKPGMVAKFISIEYKETPEEKKQKWPNTPPYEYCITVVPLAWERIVSNDSGAKEVASYSLPKTPGTPTQRFLAESAEMSSAWYHTLVSLARLVGDAYQSLDNLNDVLRDTVVEIRQDYHVQPSARDPRGRDFWNFVRFVPDDELPEIMAKASAAKMAQPANGPEVSASSNAMLDTLQELASGKPFTQASMVAIIKANRDKLIKAGLYGPLFSGINTGNLIRELVAAKLLTQSTEGDETLFAVA